MMGNAIPASAMCSPKWTDVQAQPTDVDTNPVLLCSKVFAAAARVKPYLTRFGLTERSASKRLDRADVDALGTGTALGFNALGGRLERQIGEHSRETHAGAVLGCYQQAVLPDPAQACQMGSCLVGEERAQCLSIHGLRSGDWQRYEPASLNRLGKM